MKNLTDDAKNLGILNYSHPSASTVPAPVLDQSGLGSIQTEDRHFGDGNIAGEV